jgi:hypothetical protein
MAQDKNSASRWEAFSETELVLLLQGARSLPPFEIAKTLVEEIIAEQDRRNG